MNAGAIERLYRRILMALAPARITTSDDSGLVQRLQVAIGPELIDTVPRMAEYGFTSRPKPGAKAVAVFLRGDRSSPIVIATGDPASRMTGLVEGEVAIYDDLGQSVHLTRSGIVVTGAGLPITVNNAPTVTVNAATEVVLNTPNLIVDGNIKATGDIIDNTASNAQSMASMRSAHNDHHHGNVTHGGDLSDVPDIQL